MKLLCCSIDNSEISISIGYYKKNVWTIEFCEILPFNKNQNLILREKIELACEKLIELKSKKIITKKKIYFVIDDNSIISKNILVPTLYNKKEQLETLHWAIRNEHILTEENYLKYKVIRQKVDKSIKQTEYLINAINRKETINLCSFIKEKTGLTPKIIVSKDYCVYSLYSSLYQIKEGEIYSIINFQRNNTFILMLTKNGVLFSRDIPIGYYNITELLIQKFKISEAESEEMQKIAADAYKNQIRGSEAYSALDEFLSRFTDNINRTFDYFSSIEHNRRLDGIILTGNDIIISLIEDKISKNFLNVKLETLTLRLNISDKYFSENKEKGSQIQLIKNSAVNYCGLYFDKIREMDIIPPYFKKFNAFSSLMIGLYYLLFLIITSLIIGKSSANYYQDKQQKLVEHIKLIEEQIAKEKSEIQTKSQIIKNNKRSDEQIDIEIKMLEDTKNSILTRYNDIAQFTPNKIKYSQIYNIILNTGNAAYLQELYFDSDKIKIIGIAIEQETIIEYSKNLENNNNVLDLKINSIEDIIIKNKKLKKFIIEFRYVD
ncbi:MAG TPA: pilus assembly protein PilM [bacterium]|nr:pilus assembly protein PilM [bacterium]